MNHLRSSRIWWDMLFERHFINNMIITVIKHELCMLIYSVKAVWFLFQKWSQIGEFLIWFWWFKPSAFRNRSSCAHLRMSPSQCIATSSCFLCTCIRPCFQGGEMHLNLRGKSYLSSPPTEDTVLSDWKAQALRQRMVSCFFFSPQSVFLTSLSTNWFHHHLFSIFSGPFWMWLDCTLTCSTLNISW